MIPGPARLSDQVLHVWMIQAHQGCVTDQCRKTPASPKSITSVTTALPFLKSIPARAGKSANANESDARDDVSPSITCVPSGTGFKMSRASFKLYSEKLELLRGGRSAEDKSVERWGRRRNGEASSTVMARRMPCPAGFPTGAAPMERLALADSGREEAAGMSSDIDMVDGDASAAGGAGEDKAGGHGKGH